ncbi:hypothetical protein [Clostridium estertheticum]|uniref:hypothetical protein n=1 Tax=Clostridium estertheticum TaxID=238834 RepID=UPI001C7CCA72|nr:hypothetical protein [Clostridium estertheticum]MBX4265705.1 hypothetical protein [Clostridium estertheticum]MBX4271533.1 hypothetical protein [Clostridium estertheticum]WLC82223.1 hypothetical protein KTC98_22365 [Clostridium estertheticum]WLC90958.1 hypothetical protein KTC95_22920 [Clostridium estertheticum]
MPHNADAPIRNNADLAGRLILIDIESWKINELVVESLSKNPPLMGLTIDDIKERVSDLIQNDMMKPDRQKIKNTVTQMQKIITDKDDIFKVLEWKDDMIYITDPLFLFYLRWGR